MFMTLAIAIYLSSGHLLFATACWFMDKLLDADCSLLVSKLINQSSILDINLKSNKVSMIFFFTRISLKWWREYNDDLHRVWWFEAIDMAHIWLTIKHWFASKITRELDTQSKKRDKTKKSIHNEAIFNR